MSYDVRQSPAWKATRKRILDAARRNGTPCALCRHAIDVSAPPRSRYSPSMDHVMPLDWGGNPFAGDNLQVCHYGCNSSKAAGNRVGPPSTRDYRRNRRQGRLTAPQVRPRRHPRIPAVDG
jgi:5-methylcytosine-specific restriction endonuclease McrA